MSTRKNRQQTRKSVRPTRRGQADAQQLEKLVRAGVEQFMLRDATIYDFLKMLRSASRRESVAPHPLTRGVFSKIVKEAIKKRRQQKTKK
ncbi:MAG: hypothetical protein HY961_00455 [Ignavibacteriae bacterium]|nr:hypothetical protein [Ignavibacteriota bacterium]